MKKIHLWMLVASVGLFTTCQSEDIEQEEKGKEETFVPMLFSEKIEKDNTFTFDLFRATYANAKEENLFISPLSVSLAFNMVLNGARGDTRTEILEALRCKGYSVEDVNEYSQSLGVNLVNAIGLSFADEMKFSIANSMWFHDNWGSYPVKKDFIEINKKYYDAEVNEIDFGASDALTRINGWCAEKTNNKIKKVLDKVDPAALMYIINAVYFKGVWYYPFLDELTQPGQFYPETGKSMEADMMTATGYYNYFEDDYCQYLELPYKSPNFGMVLMLPREGKTTGDVIRSMDNDRWTMVEDTFASKNVYLQLPRFQFECRYEMQDDILPDMGMKKPFDPNEADFKGIIDMSLYISRVIHNTFIEVNEKGTEVAATTVIEFPIGGSGIKPPKPIDYIVNKPFLFAIREKTTGAILFIGKVGKI